MEMHRTVMILLLRMNFQRFKIGAGAGLVRAFTGAITGRPVDAFTNGMGAFALEFAEDTAWRFIYKAHEYWF